MQVMKASTTTRSCPITSVKSLVLEVIERDDESNPDLVDVRITAILVGEENNKPVTVYTSDQPVHRDDSHDAFKLLQNRAAQKGWLDFEPVTFDGFTLPSWAIPGGTCDDI